MRPDLVMQRDGVTIVFEVKPDSSQASFFAGLGQLLVYRYSLGPTVSRAFLVAPDYPFAESSTFEAILADLKLELLRFSDLKGGTYSFPDLTRIFRLG